MPIQFFYDIWQKKHVSIHVQSVSHDLFLMSSMVKNTFRMLPSLDTLLPYPSIVLPACFGCIHHIRWKRLSVWIWSYSDTFSSDPLTFIQPKVDASAHRVLQTVIDAYNKRDVLVQFSKRELTEITRKFPHAKRPWWDLCIWNDN